MVWGCISWSGKPSLVVVSTTMKAQRYVTMLKEHLVPCAEEKFPDGWILQQDGAAPLTANLTRQYFADADIDVLPWPARSSDLSPIENAWGLLAQKVYAPGRQYEYEDDLVDAIHRAWDEIDVDTVHGLLRSMPNRLIEVLTKRSGPTHY